MDLISALKNRDLKRVKLLLDSPTIDVNFQDFYGDTALHWASNYKYDEIVKLLLDSPTIDVNIQDSRGDTALILASCGYIEIVKLLLDFPTIDVNIRGEYDDTALQRASHQNHIGVVKLITDFKLKKLKKVFNQDVVSIIVKYY